MKDARTLLCEADLDPVVKAWLLEKFDHCVDFYCRGFRTKEEFTNQISVILNLAGV